MNVRDELLRLKLLARGHDNNPMVQLIDELISKLQKESEFIVVYDEREECDNAKYFETHTDWAWSPQNRTDVMNYNAVLGVAKDKLLWEQKDEVLWKEYHKGELENREPQLKNVRLFVRYCDVPVDNEIREKAQEAYKRETDEKKRKELEVKEQVEAQKRHWIRKLQEEGYLVEKKENGK